MASACLMSKFLPTLKRRAYELNGECSGHRVEENNSIEPAAQRSPSTSLGGVGWSRGRGGDRLLGLARTWKLLRETTHILLEGTPADVDVDGLTKAILASPGVVGMHDLHVWTITSARHILTAHVVVADTSDRQTVLETLSAALRRDFNLAHTTIQLEDQACGDLHGGLDGAEPPQTGKAYGHSH